MSLADATRYLLRHRLAALAVVFFSPLIPLLADFAGLNGVGNLLLAYSFGSVGILLATIITLHDGEKQGFIFTLAATLPYGIIFLVSMGKHSDALGLGMGIGSAVLTNLLTYCWAVMLRYGARWSSLFQLAALGGVLVVSVLHLANPQLPEWWAGQIQASYTAALAKQTAIHHTAEMQAQAIEFISFIKNYITGVLVAFLLLGSFMQLVIAHWWQYRLFQFGSKPSELRKIRLNHIAGGLFVIGLALYYVGNVVVLDMFTIVQLLFVIAGISIVHYWFGLMTSNTVWFWIAAFYILLPVVVGLEAFLVLLSSIAFLDIWFDFRRRLVRI